MTTKPSLEIIIERLKQNTELTKAVRVELQQGFTQLNGRVSKNTDDIKELEFWKKYEEQTRKEAAEQAKELLEHAANEARKSVKDDAPVGSNKWLIATLVTIILGLITAVVTVGSR